jgi:hypothetical protein
MGMFDTMIMLGKSADLVACAHGHAQDDLQTKSLECSLDDYYIYERVLYRKTRSGDRIPKTRQVEEGKLTLRFESEATLVAHTGEVVAYTHCEVCDPIVFENWSSFHGGVGDRRIWVEYVLEFRDGRLVKAAPLSVKTREETREQMLSDGVAVLSDDDRVARRHLEMYRKKVDSRNDV